MEFIDEAFKQVLKAFRCPTCGKRFLKKDIKLKGFLDNTYIFHTYCDRGHNPTMAECVIFIDANTKSLNPQDITDIKEEINEFDGNFESLFNKKK